MQVQYFETGSNDPAFNLAFEQFLLEHRQEGDLLMLWQNDNTIVIGRNQNTLEEINSEYVEANQIHVVRRMTGGGAVYHDLGNLNYSFITDYDKDAVDAFTRFTIPVVEALHLLGIDAKASGRNDIVVGGKKISGTAQRVYKGRVLHHGTLLFDSNPEVIASALHADPEKFASKSTKSVRSRVGNIRSFLNNDMTLSEFWMHLKKVFGGVGYLPSALSIEELMEVQALADQTYRTWEWNYGSSPACAVKNSKRYEGGRLTTSFSIKEGKIAEIYFSGDFLSKLPVADLAQALTGCLYKEADISSQLDRFNLSDYFGGITKEEIIKTII